ELCTMQFLPVPIRNPAASTSRRRPGHWLGLICCFAVAISLYPGRAQAADTDDPIVAEIDKLIRKGWQENSVTPSERAADGEFARRVSLDVVGHIPPLEMLNEFLDDSSTDKRRKFVNKLLDDSGYVKNWSTIWANI